MKHIYWRGPASHLHKVDSSDIISLLSSDIIQPGVPCCMSSMVPTLPLVMSAIQLSLCLYCHCQATAVTPRGTTSPGTCTSRGFNWLDAMSRSAWDFSNQAAGFLASGSWSCTYGGTRGCAGNLERLHNNVHNTVGGDMSTLSKAGWDPVFW